LNLKHNPQAQIQIGSEKIAVLAEESGAQERDRLWSEWIRQNPGYKGYQARTSRKLPIVILKPAKPT
jgi:deazaflavin-dependent oxidoreductase (nitroreductase family)